MDYHVIVIEKGKPTHHWCYGELELAIKQLSSLLTVFNDVPQISATIVKSSNYGSTCSELILNQIERPNFDLD